MNFYTDETYGERIAGVYDDMHFQVESGLIDRLAELADGGLALELGIGTGRIALPLAERGVNVSGIDTAQLMPDACGKAGANQIEPHPAVLQMRRLSESFNRLRY
jgi:ubiquinone/menaquinone biosynthesis C-methylase UbiE